MTIADLFDRCVAAAFDKQIRLNDRLAEWPEAALDLQAETITFSQTSAGTTRRLVHPVQLIGEESHLPGTWQWGWACNDRVPASLLRSSVVLRRLGERRQIEELTTPQLPLEVMDGELASMIASGLSKGPGYYRVPDERADVFVLLEGSDLVSEVEHPVERMATILPTLLSRFAIGNHRRTLAQYAEFYGLQVIALGSKLTATAKGGGRVDATFDELGQLQGIQTYSG